MKLFQTAVCMAAGSSVFVQDSTVFDQQAIYFANHASHLDALLVWASLPAPVAECCVTAAAKDYWDKTSLHRFIANCLFKTVLIERKNVTRENNPLRQLHATIQQGNSLLIFPEGTRTSNCKSLRPFKSGLYHLAKSKPTLPVVPIYLHNLSRVLPKGELIPVPLMTRVFFGKPYYLNEDESREDFLIRMKAQLEGLRPHAQ